MLDDTKRVPRDARCKPDAGERRIPGRAGTVVGGLVRNGYLPAREVLTAVGSVPVQVPKVRDRSGSAVKFGSALVPPYVRRRARESAALQWLFLKGISSGDLVEALEVLVGEEPKGLCPAALRRLKMQWSEEYQDWNRRRLEGKQYAYW